MSLLKLNFKLSALYPLGLEFSFKVDTHHYLISNWRITSCQAVLFRFFELLYRYSSGLSNQNDNEAIPPTTIYSNIKGGYGVVGAY